MTDRDYREYRAALRTEARPLILRMERRGFRFRLLDGRVHITPASQLTPDDRAALREHALDVRVLVTHRADWYDWASRRMPRFDPTRAFFVLARAS